MISAAKTKVLVAEDDDLVLGLLVTRLETAGYWVIATRDGERALEAARQSLPAVIVLDVNMPKMDGFEVLNRLREMDTAHIPVLMLTGRQAVADVQKAVALGARDYLTKPVDQFQLLSRVARLVRKAPPRQGQVWI